MTAYLDVLDETQLHRDQELSRYTGEPLATIRKKTVGAPSSIQLFKDEDCTADSCDFIYEAFPYIDDQTHLLRTLTAYIVTRRAHYMRGLLQHLGHPWKGVRLLDFGCGVGSHGIHAAHHGAGVDFLDVDGPLRQYAQWRVAQRGLPGTFLLPQDLPNEPVYDAVVCLDVLEHLADPVKTFRAITETMRPGAVLALEVSKMVKPTSGHFSRNIERWQTEGAQVLRSEFVPIKRGFWRKR